MSLTVGQRVRHKMSGELATVTAVGGTLATYNGMQPTCSVKFDSGIPLSVSLESEWEAV